MMFVVIVMIVVLVALIILGTASLRRLLITRHLLPWFNRTLPPMSDAERAAVESGTVGFEAELFSGLPDFSRLKGFNAQQLSVAEIAFLENEVEALCAMLSDWEVDQARDLPARVWSFIREHGFFGMIVPRRYGGLEFSTAAHAAVVTKIASRNVTAAVTVMVPNSLGPAELLLHYGTEEQKDYYLPRLARGDEIPCFALTSPWAGSDAAAIPDTGRVVREPWQGKETLGFRLTWSKRYITLGPIATVLGLAFKVDDRDHLLSNNPAPGITCALIPATHEGVHIGRRHAPMEGSFMNGPNWGTDVFIPIDWVIGGQAQVGHGWAMLMECLAAGRSISLPSVGIATQMLALRTVGAYAGLRRQFGLPIGKFHGVAKPLAEMAARLYAQDGARRITYFELDHGEKPAVASAILKYHLTEGGRRSVIDGMDILGGKGICLGPRNFLARAYEMTPISITVEGANILTRNLIIFGQGAIRCHPYVQREMRAAAAFDLLEFDRAISEHVAHTATNALRALGLLFLAEPPDHETRLSDLWTDLAQLSARFALAADFAMLLLGGNLKRLELQSARLGDVLSHLYLAAGALVRWDSEGRCEEDLELARLATQNELHQAYRALSRLFANSRGPLRFLRFLAMPTGISVSAPLDAQWLAVAESVIKPSALRDRLTAGMFLPQSSETSEPVGQLEQALAATVILHETDAALHKLEGDETAYRNAIAALPAREAQAWVTREHLLADIIAVDEFEKDAFPGVGHSKAADLHNATANANAIAKRLRA